MADPILLGNVVVLTAQFTDPVTKRPLDPAAVRLRIKLSAGAEQLFVYQTHLELVRKNRGVYELRYTPDKPGDWWYRFEGEAPVKAADEGFFTIVDSEFSTSVTPLAIIASTVVIAPPTVT